MRTLTRISLLTFLAALVFLSSPHPAPAFAQDDQGSDSFEYKMLLLPALFADREAGMQKFWSEVEKCAAGMNLRVKEFDAKPASERSVRFIDTKKFDIFKTGYILRDRSAKRGSLELTLKFRSSDAAVTSSKDVSPAAGLGGEVLFDEDIVARENSIDRIYSKSGKVVVDSEPVMTVEGAAKIFPAVAGLGIAAKEELFTVNGIRVGETSVDYGRIYFGSSAKAKASFAAWFVNGRLLIVEFSFRLKLGESKPEAVKNRISRNADVFFKSLRDRVKPWMAVGQTKTGLIYKMDGGNQE